MCFPRDPALKIWSQTIWNCHQKTGVFCKSQRGREKTPLLTNLLGEATCGVSSLLLKKALKKKKKKKAFLFIQELGPLVKWSVLHWAGSGHTGL